jgi:hypothetical protein
MKRKRYTYIPKDEIAEVRTFNDVSFESDDLLDGAYVKGRKKFARGGMPSKRPMTYEEQAAEAVGYDVWYSMDAVDQRELIYELLVSGSGIIDVKMAQEAYQNEIYRSDYPEESYYGSSNTPFYSVFNYELKVQPDYPYKNIANRWLEDNSKDSLKYKLAVLLLRGQKDPDEILGIEKMSQYAALLRSLEKAKGESEHEMSFRTESYSISEAEKWARESLSDIFYVHGEMMADGGIMANGGDTAGNQYLIYSSPDKHKTENYFKNKKYKQEYKDDFDDIFDLKIIEVPYDDFIDYRIIATKKMDDGGIMADGGYVAVSEKDGYLFIISKPTTKQKAQQQIDLGGIPEGEKAKVISVEDAKAHKKVIGREYLSDSQEFSDGGVVSYSVKYSMKENPEIVKEKVFADKDSAEFFYETISDDEDLVVMDLQEIKSAPKKSLFAMAKPAPATAASKKKRERVQVDGIADEIARYDALKATINNAKAEQEVIGGMLKEIGRDKFLDLYEQRGVRPANFDLADGSENILLEILDKYLKVEPEKAQILRQFDGLLEEKTSYEFDSELLEKEVSDGMTIGDVVSMLIQDSKLIPDGDKANLIKAKMTMRIPKGTIDRLMDYDNPREVFNLISPILALK